MGSTVRYLGVELEDGHLQSALAAGLQPGVSHPLDSSFSFSSSLRCLLFVGFSLLLALAVVAGGPKGVPSLVKELQLLRLAAGRAELVGVLWTPALCGADSASAVFAY